MTVSDVVEALAVFDDALAVVFGLAVATILVSTVIRWFRQAVE